MGCGIAAGGGAHPTWSLNPAAVCPLAAAATACAQQASLLVVTTALQHACAPSSRPDRLLLRRNVTLTAPNGLMPLLDFQFVRSAVHLCATCVFHMRHISIANERRGNGAAIDFFVGVPGSVVKLEDALRLRLACTTTGVHAHIKSSVEEDVPCDSSSRTWHPAPVFSRAAVAGHPSVGWASRSAGNDALVWTLQLSGARHTCRCSLL